MYVWLFEPLTIMNHLKRRGSGVSFSGTNFQQLATVPERCETAQLLEALDSQVPTWGDHVGQMQYGDIICI